MSSSVPSRPLSLRPFLAADAVLLLTAFLIAWRTQGELAGGSLLGVIICTGLSAVLTVLPFVLNDTREREAALAERQRELLDVVSSSTALSSRWGTQWTAAATGLEAAAGLATRNLAVAERLPVVFQDKIDALANLLAQTELTAKAREEHAAQQAAALSLRTEHAVAIAAELERTLAAFGRLETNLHQQHRALEATLAEFPAAVARAQSAREKMDERLASAPAQIESHLVRLTTEAEARLATTTDALLSRLAGLESALRSLQERLEQVKTLESPTSASAQPESAHVAKAPVIVAHPDALKPVGKDSIMDPFFIPSDGYSALADAMDERRA